MSKIIEIDCSTGESIERDMTSDELAAHAAMQAQAESDRIAAEAEATRIAELKASAKAKLVAGQPLTAGEADTLVF